MRKIVLIFIFAAWTLNLFSQDQVPTEKALNDFFNTKTYIVSSSRTLSSYNMQVKDAVEAYWDLTEYEFLEHNEFDKKRNNPEYSFLIEDFTVFERDKTKVRYRFLSLLKGEEESSLDEMPTICSVPLSYREVDDKYWAYKIGIIVRFMQKHVRNMKENPDIIDDDVFEHYHKNLEDIKDKTLYLIEGELADEVNTKGEIEDVYPYDFKIVNRDEVKQAIKDQREDVVFLHKVGPQGTRRKARCYKILIGADDARFYYYNYHNISKGRRPDGFLKRDFRRIERKINGGLFGL